MKQRYPLCKEIPWMQPAQARQCCPSANSVWLDSALEESERGQLSYIAVDPFQRWVLARGCLHGKTLDKKPFAALKQWLAPFTLSKLPDVPPFQGGVAGFFSYDLVWYEEDLPNRAMHNPAFEDWILGMYDLVLAFHHGEQRAWIVSTGFPEQEERARLNRAARRMEWLEGCLAQESEAYSATFKALPRELLSSSHDAQSYEQAVQRTIDYILAGDIFEANIAQRFSAPFAKQDLSALYTKLRRLNPAPFAAWLCFDETQILSASPERFLLLQGGKVETRPIKGTAARHPDPERDKLFAQALLASEKDRAENIMIVDLMRNDLSKVCEPSSVSVSQLCGLESFKQVHHLVSVVTGSLKQGVGAVDLLKATFPGGSITGAPKVRAMEIIEELEAYKRGPYCGSIGYIAFHGDMDSSITIRTFAYKDDQLVFSAGGAVTMDSDPKLEYQESLAKARALIETLTA